MGHVCVISLQTSKVAYMFGYDAFLGRSREQASCRALQYISNVLRLVPLKIPCQRDSPQPPQCAPKLSL
jgi:hypothetical protein